MASKLLACIIALLFLCTANPGFASTPDTYLLFSISSQNKARLGIVNNTRKNLRLEIVNTDDNVLFEKLVTSYENFFQLVDLSKIPNGEYVVRMTQGNEEEDSKKFKVEDGVASLVKPPKEMPPVFRLVEDNSLIVSYLNAESKTVSIFFEQHDEIVFEDRNIAGSPVSKRYSLEKLPKGEYKVMLYSGGRVYDYTMTLN